MLELQKLSKENFKEQSQWVYTDSLFDRNLTKAVGQDELIPYAMVNGQDLVCQIFTKIVKAKGLDQEDVAQVVPVLPLTTKILRVLGILLEESGIQSRQWPTHYLVRDSQDHWHHPYRIPARTTIDGDLIYGDYRNLRFEFNSPTLDHIPENLTVNGKLGFHAEDQVKLLLATAVTYVKDRI